MDYLGSPTGECKPLTRQDLIDAATRPIPSKPYQQVVSPAVFRAMVARGEIDGAGNRLPRVKRG